MAMSDLPTPTPTSQQAPPGSGAGPTAPPPDSDLGNQIDSLLAQIDLGRARLEEQAANITQPAPPENSPVSAADIESQLDDLLRESGASVPASSTAEDVATGALAPSVDSAPQGATDATTTHAPQAGTQPSPAAPEPDAFETVTDSTAPASDLSSEIDELLQQATTGEPLTQPAASAPAAPPPPAPAPAATPSSPSEPAPYVPTPASPHAPAAAPTPTATATAVATSAASLAPAPVAPPASPIAQRLAAVLARALTPFSAPLASQSSLVRDSLGWVAANTIFLGACLWGYIEFFRPEPKVAHTQGTFDFAHDDVPPIPDPDRSPTDARGSTDHKSDTSHGTDPKAKSGTHGVEKKAAAKKPDAKKADPHTKTPAKGGH